MNYKIVVLFKRFCVINLLVLSCSFFYAQNTVAGSLTWTYDLPDDKPTHIQRVQVDMKYELYTEKIGNRYKVWARFKFVPQFTKIQPERGGTYHYKYNGKWYDSDEMWRVDSRTTDGFMNTYGFIPDLQINQVSLSGNIIGDHKALFYASTSDSWHTNSAMLGYISNPNELSEISINPNNTYINYVGVINTSKLHKRIADYEKKLASNERYDDMLQKANQAFANKKYREAEQLYRSALEIKKGDSTAQNWMNESKRLADLEGSEVKNESNQPKQESKLSNSTSKDNFWNDNNSSKNSNAPQKTTITKQKMSVDEQIAYTKKITEEINRTEKAKRDTYFANERTRLQNEAQNKLKVLSTSFYANQARSSAEQGIKENSSFGRKYDNVEDLQEAFNQQSEQINSNAQNLLDARMQQNQNNLDYYWGTSTGTDRALGELATGIANIIGQAQAEKERKQAIEKLKKERDAQIAQIAEDKKRKLKELRNSIFEQFPEGGVPLSKHNVEAEELYFFAYSYDGDKKVKLTKLFPYARYKDGTWAFKDRVKAESERVLEGNVTLVGYYTDLALAEKEWDVLTNLLPKANIDYEIFSVKGKKKEDDTNENLDFWGDSPVKEKPKPKSTSKKQEDDFWNSPQSTEKKVEKHLSEFAQNDNLKARIEYEEAEVTFQDKNYRKAITKLTDAEKFLGRWTPKASYLKILALDKIVIYTQWDKNSKELYTQVKKYMQYFEKNTKNIEVDKMREIYQIEKKINLTKKIHDFEIDPLYTAANKALEKEEYSTALELYTKAANSQNFVAMDMISNMYSSGVGVDKDYEKSIEWDTKASNLGYSESTTDLGMMYYGGFGVAKNYKKALDYFLKAAESRHPKAMEYIGKIYKEGGNGASKDDKQAIHWFKEAVKFGRTENLMNIGDIYNFGSGTSQYNAEACKWYEKAVDNKILLGHVQFGICYLMGNGINRDYDKAITNFKIASENLNATEQEVPIRKLLGLAYFGKEEYTEALNWFIKSYENGFKESKDNIANMYENGLGVKKDKKLAKEWRSK